MRKQEINPICPINIGRKEQIRRLLFGVFMLLFIACLIVILNMNGLSRWWRIGLLGPFYLAALGFFQACEKT